MDKFSTYFGRKLCFLIFSTIEQLSVITLQSINTTVYDCYYSVDLCIRALERNRTDKNFYSFFILFEKRQPTNVILPSYQEGGSSLEELMVVLFNMCSLLQKIFTEGNTLRLLILSRDSSKGVPSKKISFLLGQANYIHSLASATSSKYVPAAGNFTKRKHEIYITKMNIPVIFNIFTKLSDHENLKIYSTLPCFPNWCHAS